MERRGEKVERVVEERPGGEVIGEERVEKREVRRSVWGEERGKEACLEESRREEASSNKNFPLMKRTLK